MVRLRSGSSRRNLTDSFPRHIIAGMPEGLVAQEPAVEREKEIQWQEVPEEELSECGWKYVERTDGHVFTILVRQGTEFNRAISLGRGICARHQMKAVSGRELLPGSHIDSLRKDRFGGSGPDILVTNYDPSIGHHDFIVLETIK